MKELKYRAWDKSNKQMLYDYCYLNKGNKFNCYTSTDNIRVIESVTQYTGLKDRNGIEIYEDDIVKLYFDISQINAFIRKIEYDHGTFFVMDIFNKRYYPLHNFVPLLDSNGNKIYKNMQVIGNIYENSELLKEE